MLYNIINTYLGRYPGCIYFGLASLHSLSKRLVQTWVLIWPSLSFFFLFFMSWWSNRPLPVASGGFKADTISPCVSSR